MPTSRPTISIIVPVYNVKNYLSHCLQSILAQSINDWETIIVDDGSTDGSGEICDTFAKKDPRFKVIHQPNMGIGDARNRGIAMAKGEYIGFVDPDDWIPDNYFSSMISALQSKNCDVSVASVAYEYSGGQAVNILEDECFSGLEFASLLCEDKRHHNYFWNKVFKRDFVSPIPDGVRCFEDIIVLVDWLLRAHKVTTVSNTIYHYRQRKTSILNSTSAKEKLEAFVVAVKHRTESIESHIFDDEFTPIMAAKCVSGTIRTMALLVRDDNSQTISSRILAKTITELHDSVYEMFIIAHKSRNLTIKQIFRYNLAGISPSMFIRWMRFTNRLHRKHNSNRKFN